MNLSLTTKYNCLHELKDQKKKYDDDGWDCKVLWDEYDLDYLISLVEHDIQISK